jgi:hypothetical protein
MWKKKYISEDNNTLSEDAAASIFRAEDGHIRYTYTKIHRVTPDISMNKTKIDCLLN